MGVGALFTRVLIQRLPNKGTQVLYIMWSTLLSTSIKYTRLIRLSKKDIVDVQSLQQTYLHVYHQPHLCEHEAPYRTIETALGLESVARALG